MIRNRQGFRRQGYWLFLLCFSLFQFLIPIQDSFGSDFQSPRTTALGGAGHAAPFLTDAIYLNPSHLYLLPFFGAGANYLYHEASFFPSTTGSGVGSDYNLSVMASSRQLPVQFGAGYTRRDDGTLIHFAASFGLWDRLSLGVGAQFLTTPSGNLIGSPDMGLSMSMIVSTSFRLAVVVDHVLGALQSNGFFTDIIVGSKWQILPEWSILVDPHFGPDTLGGAYALGIEAGTEVRIGEYLFVRAGGYSNSVLPFVQVKGSGVSGGLGFTFPKVAIDYALGGVLSPQVGLFHNIGVKVFF